jgi:alpha-L-rhamnosidase
VVTTFWELWNGNTAAPDMNSQNHVMLLGDMLIWFFEDLAGIRSHPDHQAFKKILMEPVFPDELDHVDASFQSVHGSIGSKWTIEEDSLIWHIKIPANSSAEVYLPAIHEKQVTESGNPLRKVEGIASIRQSESDMIIEIGSGSYLFSILHSPKRSKASRN